jgi:hypothetical protein
MDINDTAKIDSILDKANEVREILQQEYVAGNIDIKTV